MDPAKYDITVYRGVPWQRFVRRRSLDGAALPVAAPCVIAVRKMTPEGQAPSVTFSVPGVVDDSSSEVLFALSATDTAALEVGPYRYLCTLSEPDLSRTTVALEGDFTVKPGVV